MADPLFLEALDYSAIEVRQLIAACLTEGVVGAGDLEVTAGTGTTVDAAAGLAVVAGTDNDEQGSYVVPVGEADTAKREGIAIAAAPGSNSRIDVVYLKVRDNTEDSGGNDDWVIDVQEGTPAADPSAPAIPDTAIALAEVLVTAGDTASTDYTITDVRLRAVPHGPRVVKTTTLVGGTGGFSTETTLMSLDIPAQGFPYRAVLSARVRVKTFAGAAGLTKLKDGSTLIGQVQSDYVSDVSVLIADVDMEVSDGAAKTITLTMLPDTGEWQTEDVAAEQFLRAEIWPL